eukprot:5111345-Amphidinium_carterae.1
MMMMMILTVCEFSFSIVNVILPPSYFVKCFGTPILSFMLDDCTAAACAVLFEGPQQLEQTRPLAPVGCRQTHVQLDTH